MTAAAMVPLADLHEEAHRRRAMWVAVVHRAILDASRADEHGTDARAWCARPDALALELAGLDADSVAPALARMADHASYALLHTLGPSDA